MRLSLNMKKNNNALVSVIIPVYNVEKYLVDSLDSVCKQTYKNLEIIIVYTESSDNSLTICKKFADEDSRILIEFENRQGLGLARDKGISIAKGEWICFVDSDDYIHTDFVRILLETALEKDCMTAHCRYEKVYEKKQESINGSGRVSLLDWERYFCYLFTHQSEGHSPFGVWANIYHRSLFKNVSFGSLRYAEDSAFSPRIIYAAKERPIAVVDRVLYYYLQRYGSLLHQRPSLIRIDQCKAKKIAIDFFSSVAADNMYNLFYPIYCNCLMNDYIELSFFLPEKKKEYQFLYDDFIKEIPKMKEYCFPFFKIHPHAKYILDKIRNHNGEIVIYGYGSFGKKIYDGLKYVNIKTKEIWDKRFVEVELSDGVICRQMHDGFSKDILILISINESGLANEARIDLTNLGYKNFIEGLAIMETLNFAKIQRYFPCLLNEYVIIE